MASGLERAWRRAATLAPEHALALPFTGETVAVVGTGVAAGIARAYAALRDDAAQGWTDAAAPDELPMRAYDRTVLLSRTGSEQSLVELVERLRSEAILAIAIGAPAGSPLDRLAGVTVPIAVDAVDGVGPDGAYALTTSVVLRQHLLGRIELREAARAARAALPDVSGMRRWVFVGRRWSLGLADAAARGFRASAVEAVAGTPSELASGELGPLDERTLVWPLEPTEVDVGDAALRRATSEPFAELVLALRVAGSLG